MRTDAGTTASTPHQSPGTGATRLLALGLVLIAAACTRDQWHRAPSPDDAIAAIPWFSTMHRGPAIQTYQMPRTPVPGTVPITGTETPTPFTANAADLARINAVRNPVGRTAQSLERGEDRYDIYCSVCHGVEGRGDGTVPKGTRWPIPSLVTAQARAYTDGYLYNIVRHGRGLMPAYGDRLIAEDRWNVVNYVRQLQGNAP